MNLKTPTVAKVAAALLASAAILPAQAQLFVDIGTIQLAPNQAGQSFDLFLRNDGAAGQLVGGFELAIQVDDGTSGPALTLTTDSFTSTSGTIFPAARTSVTPDNGNTPHLQFWSTSVDPAPYPALTTGNNKVATLTFDTTGISSGSWPILVVGTGFNDSGFQDPNGDLINVTFNNGTALVAVPEIQAAHIVAGLLGALAIVHKVKGRQKKAASLAA